MQTTLGLGAEATFNLCVETVRFALPKGCPEREEKKEERNSTNKNIIESTEERKSTTLGPEESLACPNNRNCFS